jgi:hypothetical protein
MPSSQIRDDSATVSKSSRKSRHVAPTLPDSSSVPPALSVNDLLFINEYFRNGQNATQAYRSVHPKAKYDAAAVSANRLLKKAKIQQEIAQRVQHEAGVTKDFIESSLLKYQRMADAAGDYLAGASICMDAAKVAGLLIDRQERKLVQNDQQDAIRSLIQDAFRSSPTLPPSTKQPSDSSTTPPSLPDPVPSPVAEPSLPLRNQQNGN